MTDRLPIALPRTPYSLTSMFAQATQLASDLHELGDDRHAQVAGFAELLGCLTEETR